MFFQLIPLRMPDDVEMIGAFGVGRLPREQQRGVLKQFMVAVRHAAALRCPPLQMRQLHAQHRTLNAFHAVIEPDFIVIIAHGGAVLAQRTRAFGKFRIVGHERAAFAAGSQVFAGIKTEAGHLAERADFFAPVGRRMRLRGILHQRQPMFATDFQNRVDVERVPVKMDGHHHLGFGGDGALELFRVEIHRPLLDIHIDRLCADIGNRPARRHECVGGGDHFIPRLEAEQQQRNMQGRCPAVEGDAMLRADEGGEIFFELHHVRAQAK